MSENDAARSKPSLAQVKAWLDTVVGPMTSALRVEREILAEGNPSFRAYAYTIDFEFLTGSDRLVSRRHEPNRVQFFRRYVDIEPLTSRHDEALDRLRRACAAAFEELLKFEAFARLCVDKTEAERRSLAQDVINGVEQLEAYDPLASFWNPRAKEFLALRSGPTLKPWFESIDKAKADLRAAVGQLLGRLSDLQQRLADEYDLPAVDPAMTGY